MIRGALQREIQCHFEIEPAGRSDEGLEVLERAELRVNSVVPAVDRAMAHGEPTSPGSGVRVLLRPLRLISPMGWIGGR